MKSDRDRCTQKCKNLNLFPANVRCSNLENHEFMCESLFSSVEHHAKETCQKCILFFYEGYRTSSQKGRACVPKWCSRFGSHCPSTMEGTYNKQKVIFFYVFSCVWMIWLLKFLIHDFFKFKFCIRLYPRKTRQSMKERPKNARNKWKESRVTVSEWIIKDNCSPYVYCHSKVCYLGYNIILCECNSAAYGS